MEEFARITPRVARLDHWALRAVEREVVSLLAEGFMCDVCRFKVALLAVAWLSGKLPLAAWRFRSMVPPRSQLQAAGRDLDAEIQAAIRPYFRPI